MVTPQFEDGEDRAAGTDGNAGHVVPSPGPPWAARVVAGIAVALPVSLLPWLGLAVRRRDGVVVGGALALVVAVIGWVASASV